MQIIVVVNSMQDILVLEFLFAMLPITNWILQWNREHYQQIVTKVSDLLQEAGHDPARVVFVPITNLADDHDPPNLASVVHIVY